MNQLFRLLLAGMVFAAMISSRTSAGTMPPIGSMTATTMYLVSSNHRPVPPVTTARVTTAATPAIVLSHAQVTGLRTWIANELAKLDRDHAFARSAASRLTVEDLVVLAANPKMMQPAGRLTAHQENLLWATLIIAGIVALVIVADSSSVTISS